VKVALKNFGWLGYQPPLTAIDPSTLVADGYVPPNLASAVITESDFKKGQQPVQLDPEAEAQWLLTWSEVQSG
jgi:spermidine/putrescine transport system substrate-binding protein